MTNYSCLYFLTILVYRAVVQVELKKNSKTSPLLTGISSGLLNQNSNGLLNQNICLTIPAVSPS